MDSNTAFTGATSMVSLKAVRASMSAFSIVAVAGWYSTLVGEPPTAQGSRVVMILGGGRWEVGGEMRVGGRIVGRR